MGLALPLAFEGPARNKRDRHFRSREATDSPLATAATQVIDVAYVRMLARPDYRAEVALFTTSGFIGLGAADHLGLLLFLIGLAVLRLQD